MTPLTRLSPSLRNRTRERPGIATPSTGPGRRLHKTPQPNLCAESRRPLPATSPRKVHFGPVVELGSPSHPTGLSLLDRDFMERLRGRTSLRGMADALPPFEAAANGVRQAGRALAAAPPSQQAGAREALRQQQLQLIVQLRRLQMALQGRWGSGLNDSARNLRAVALADQNDWKRLDRAVAVLKALTCSPDIQRELFPSGTASVPADPSSRPDPASSQRLFEMKEHVKSRIRQVQSDLCNADWHAAREHLGRAARALDAFYAAVRDALDHPDSLWLPAADLDRLRSLLADAASARHRLDRLDRWLAQETHRVPQ